MKNKIIMAAACLSLTGCTSIIFPGWDKVVVEPSVYKKPCSLVKKDAPFIGTREHNEYFKIEASRVGANTVVSKGLTASYFYCAPGISPYIDDEHMLFFVRNRFNPSSTKLDLDKALAECSYESHAATVDTGRAPPSRIFIPTQSWRYNLDQIEAINHDRAAEEIKKIDLSIDQAKLESECISAKGFVYSKVEMTDKTLSDLKNNCPDIDNSIEPCFIPAEQKK